MMGSRFVSMNEAPTESMCDYLAKFLAQKQVKCVFELSGGMIAFITDAISKAGNIQIINVRHEQAAGFAAEGASRSGGSPSVALATSGPGATNLVTAIGSAYFDSTPVLFITGQVHQSELRQDENQRQNGFQELNIVTMVEGITKYAVQVNSIDNFNFFVNGQYIEKNAITSWVDNGGGTCTLVINSAVLTFSFDSTDLILAVGKFKP